MSTYASKQSKAESSTTSTVEAPVGEQALAAHKGTKRDAKRGKDEAGGAWRAGQVGQDFATVLAALNEGNLRERMTGIYNASLAAFKTELLHLMDEARWVEMAAPGLDTEQLRRRKRQVKWDPGAKDLYRAPGNPRDHEKPSTFELRGPTRTKAPAAAQVNQRTPEELEEELEHGGVVRSAREKRFMCPDPYTGGEKARLFAVDPNEQVTWKEGGTHGKINRDNKWMRKCQEKLYLPITAELSGTALRMFQAWEFLGKPAVKVKEHFRLALLGRMMTSNDQRCHASMMTSAEYGVPSSPGGDASPHVEPSIAEEPRAPAAPEGSRDEPHDQADRRTAGSQDAVFGAPSQLQRF